MHVRFGRLKNVRAEQKEVVADFEPIVEFGEVAFADANDATKVFQADSFQIYRTHWAVREGEAEPIFTALAERKPECAPRGGQILECHAGCPSASTRAQEEHCCQYRRRGGISRGPAGITATG